MRRNTLTLLVCIFLLEGRRDYFCIVGQNPSSYLREIVGLLHVTYRTIATIAEFENSLTTYKMVAHKNRIVVPQREIQGGFDVKFETDPYNMELYGLLTQQQYTEAIEAINKKLRPSRSSRLDAMLLVVGPLLVPLMLWGIRHRNQTRRRKRLLKIAIDEFHEQYPHLLMRWNRRPESKLTIERRPSEAPIAPPDVATADAELVGDVMVFAEPVKSPPSSAPKQSPAGHDLI